MKKWAIALLLISAMVALVVACKDDPNDPIIGGVVVDKRHRASYTTITFPVINRYPERWFLTVEVEYESGRTATKQLSVSREDWERMKVGDPWRPEK